MAQKDILDRLEKLTSRVTVLEKKPAPRTPRQEKWNTDRWIALGILVVTFAGIPLIFFGWLEPHLHADLKNDIALEVSSQLKEPNNKLEKLTVDMGEIKGKLDVLAPLIRELAVKRLSDATTFDSTDLIARLPELKSLAMFAKTERLTVKPETVEKVGKKLVEAGGTDAWNTALDFLNYKSFLNASLSVAVNSVRGTGTLTTVYTVHPPSGLGAPTFGVAGAVPKGEAAQIVELGKADPNDSLALGNDWIIGTGGALTLDNMKLKKIIFRDVAIFYDGGPLNMQDVYFINCIFHVKQQSNGERLVTTALKPSPALSFNAS